MKNPQTQALRNQIEDSLHSRFADAISFRPRVRSPQTPCGISALDELLDGGLPAGAIVELVGTASSGRTTAALTYMAKITQSGSVVAWVDAADALDPESAAACGVDLERLLWVRCGVDVQMHSPTQEFRPGISLPTKTSTGSQRHSGRSSPHPRSEAQNMPQAVSAVLKAHGGLYDKHVGGEARIGTPGAPNYPITKRLQGREEQVNSDRLPSRRGDNLALEPRCAEPQRVRISNPQPGKKPSHVVHPASRSGTSERKLWPVLDQALRVADLLLQGGGFSAIVFDLGSMPPETVWRIPPTTWFRFRAACERTRASLILLTQHPCARSSAELVIRMQTGSMEVDSTVMTGICYQAITERSPAYANNKKIVCIRKPPLSERPGIWRTDAPAQAI